MLSGIIFKTRKLIEAVPWDYDGTLVDTRQKNLDVTRVIVFEVLNKSHEKFSAVQNNCVEGYFNAIIGYEEVDFAKARSGWVITMHQSSEFSHR